jgi:hypothetical protein
MAPVYAKQLAIQILKQNGDVDGVEALTKLMSSWRDVVDQKYNNATPVKSIISNKIDMSGHGISGCRENKQPTVFHSKFHW